jgi:hypothetical protein
MVGVDERGIEPHVKVFDKSQRFRRRSSLREAKNLISPALIVVPTAIRPRRGQGFFNAIG